MTIHHIGTANDVTKALGDAITAVPIPHVTTPSAMAANTSDDKPAP